MAEDFSNKTIAAILLVVLAVSISSLMMSMDFNTKMAPLLRSVGLGGITGFAVINNTGTVNVTVTSSASVRFSQNNIDFGIGSVNSTNGNTICSLATNNSMGFKDNNAKCINFTAAASLHGFEIENDGNINITVNMTVNKNASNFVGGPGGLEMFRFNITNNESSACGTPSNAGAWTNINTSLQYALCQSVGGLSYIQNRNSMDIDVNLTIPYDSAYASGVNQVVIFTAIGTTVP